MFAQLGSTIFDGLKTFVSYSSGEEIALAEFALIGRKPQLQGAGIGLINLALSITLHAEFCNVSDEISKLQTSMRSFEILPLLWGNGKNAGNFVIKEMPVEVVNMDTLGNIYEARVNLSLIESVIDNQLSQANQNAANNAFASGNKQPATKSKRKNPTPCQKNIAALVSEIRQFGTVINNIVAVYTGAEKQATLVAQACSSIEEDCTIIENAIHDPNSCVFQNGPLFTATDAVNNAAKLLSNDIDLNAKAVSGAEVSGNIPDGYAVANDNTALQANIKALVSTANPIIKQSIVQ